MMDNQEQAFKDAMKNARVTTKGYGRFTKEEVDWIKVVFKDNDTARTTLKKVFMPMYQYGDPMGAIADLWIEARLEEMPPQDRVERMMARNMMIIHMEKMLNALWAMSQIKDESQEEKEKRLKADSSK